MTTIIVKESVDEITVTAIRFIFTTKRRYVRVDENTWYNKDLHQEITDEEWDYLTDEQIVFGKGR